MSGNQIRNKEEGKDLSSGLALRPVLMKVSWLGVHRLLHGIITPTRYLCSLRPQTKQTCPRRAGPVLPPFVPAQLLAGPAWHPWHHTHAASSQVPSMHTAAWHAPVDRGCVISAPRGLKQTMAGGGCNLCPAQWTQAIAVRSFTLTEQRYAWHQMEQPREPKPMLRSMAWSRVWLRLTALTNFAHCAMERRTT